MQGPRRFFELSKIRLRLDVRVIEVPLYVVLAQCRRTVRETRRRRVAPKTRFDKMNAIRMNDDARARNSGRDCSVDVERTRTSSNTTIIIVIIKTFMKRLFSLVRSFRYFPYRLY